MTEEKEAPDTNGQENKEEENTSEDKTELESSIIRQVEYYFGDINIPRDKFLREQMQLDEGWVPLEIMLKFNRLAKLSSDVEFISQSLLKSTSGLLEVSDDNKKVRRNPELPIPEMNEERRKELASRTIYAKGFPKDALLDDLLKFFQQFEEVENVIMRRYQDRQTKKKMFKGSVFAMFKTKEQAEKFLGLQNTKYGETELLVMSQQAYIDKKQEEYNARKQDKDKGKEKKVEVKNENKKEFKLPTGSCFKFSEGSDKMTREAIREVLTNLGGEVAYIDFKVGDTEGWVRLTKENAAKELSEKFTDGKVKIGENDVVFKVLEGDEETAYLNKTIEEMSNMKNRRRNNNKNRGWGGGHKGKQNRKRKQDNDDGPPSKVKGDS